MHRLSSKLFLAISRAISKATAQTNTLPTTGKVRIGTTNPASSLDVSTTQTDIIQIEGPTGNHLIQASTDSLEHTIGLWAGGIQQLYSSEDLFITTGTAASNTTIPTGGVMAAIITRFGNMGIGTVTPGEKLEISGNLKLTGSSGGHIVFSDGSQQSVAWTGVLSGGDYAESVNVSGNRNTYEPGDVLVINPASEGKFLKSFTPYATTVTGIYSTKPGVTGRRQRTSPEHMKEEVPMAMTGIVPTKVSAENGAIKPGDLLVTSSRSGYAMKGTDRSLMLGAVVGKAIGHLDAGTGIIDVVVTLQ